MLLHVDIQPSSSQKSNIAYKNCLNLQALSLCDFLEQLEGQSPFDVAGLEHCEVWWLQG